MAGYRGISERCFDWTRNDGFCTIHDIDKSPARLPRTYPARIASLTRAPFAVRKKLAAISYPFATRGGRED